MNWLPYIPPDSDVQHSRNSDMEACASYSFIHILEMILKKQYGYFTEFSERALAKMSDTQPWGNALINVANAGHQVLLAEDWPPLTYSGNQLDIDWNTYYAWIPPSILKRAYKLDVSFQKLTPSQVPAALQKAPLWTIVLANGVFLHAVAQISETQFYDSYEVRVKDFSPNYPIQTQYSLTINPQFIMPLYKTVRYADNKTMGMLISTPNGDQIIKATGEEQYRSWSKPDSYGKQTVNPDGTTNWNADLQLNF